MRSVMELVGGAWVVAIAVGLEALPSVGWTWVVVIAVGLKTSPSMGIDSLNPLKWEFVEIWFQLHWRRLEEVNGRKLISASLAQKHLIKTFLTSFTSCSWNILITSVRKIYCQLTHYGPCVPKTFDSSFLVIMFVVFMKNFEVCEWMKLTP